MGYEIQAASLADDKEAILEFWKRRFPNWSPDKVTWFYENNVSGKATCFLAKETAGNQIVGAAAIFPREFVLKGELMRAGITGDFAVDEKHRGFGPAVLLQRAIVETCERGEYDFLYGYPNHSSLPVQRRVGFEILGSTARVVKILRYRPYMGQRGGSLVVNRALGAALDPVARVLEREQWHKLPAELLGERIDIFDTRFDEFYRKCSQKSCLLGERTRRFLHWRFGLCPQRNYQIFTLTEKDENGLLGYVVYSLEERHANIADFLACDNEMTLEHLLASFCGYLRASGLWSVSVIYLGSSSVLQKLRKMGFHEREDKRDVVIYATKDALGEYLKNVENWHFLDGDND
jgi:GNAT superfamily N-acetyltransferase